MISIGLVAALAGCGPKQPENTEPEPQASEFTFLVDQFADLRIMRYQLDNWDQLTVQ